MNVSRTGFAWAGGGAAGFALLLVAWHVVYTSPRAKIQQDLDAARGDIGVLQKTLDSEFDLRKRAKAIGATTLAGKQDTLEHRFRSGLSRIGEQEGLAGVVVDDAAPTDQLNPLKDVKGISSSLKSALRRTPDFQLVRGTLKGTGTLEQVLKTVAVVQAQPWVHRVEGFTLKPVGQNREQLELRLDVATLFAPELLGSAEPAAPQVAAVGPDAEALWRAVAMKNVFRKPAPAQARPVQVAQGPAGGAPAPQVFAPYEEWKLTGIMNGRNGTEAFFTNVKTGAKLTVPRGGQVLDAVLVDGTGEQVVVEIGGKKFVLSNGQTLAARRPQS